MLHGLSAKITISKEEINGIARQIAEDNKAFGRLAGEIRDLLDATNENKKEIDSIKNSLSISEAMEDLQSQKSKIISDEDENESEQLEQDFDADSTDEAMSVRRNQLKTSIIESMHSRQESFRESMNEEDLAELNRRVNARMEGVRQGFCKEAFRQKGLILRWNEWEMRGWMSFERSLRILKLNG